MKPVKPVRKPFSSVELSNRWATFNCEPDLHVELKKCFRYHPEGYEFSPKFRDGSWDGFVNLFQRGRVSSGLFLAQRAEVEKKFALTVYDNRIFPKFNSIDDSALRPYQRDGLNAMVAASNTGGIILSATGSGKTLLAASFFKTLAEGGLFICDELGLLEQSRVAIERFLNEKVGGVGRSEFTPQRITVATIQTLHKHQGKAAFRKWFKRVSVAIIDELHVMLGKRNSEILQKIRPKAVFGLTATLQLEKDEVRFPAMAIAGPVIFGYLIRKGVEDGFLTKGVIFRLHFVDPLKGPAPGYFSFAEGKKLVVPVGSPSAAYRYHVCLNAVRNTCIEKIAREAVSAGRKVVVLVNRRNHLAALSKRLQDIEHAAISGETPTKARAEAIARMNAGTLHLILASRVFAKGIDVEAVDFIIDATGLPDRDSALQRYGRGVRLCASKRELIYVDISDSGNPFAGAAKMRWKALEETGSKIHNVTWYDGYEKELLRVGRGIK